jgi:hypothetical protein
VKDCSRKSSENGYIIYYPKKCLEKFFWDVLFSQENVDLPPPPANIFRKHFFRGGGGRKEGGPNLFLKKDKLFFLNLLRTSLLIPNPFLLAGAAYDRLKIATRTYR